MSLEELRKSLVQEAKSEERRLTSAAEKQASQSLEAAAAQAERIRTEARERAQRAAAAEKNERLSASQLRAKKITSEAQNMVLQQGLNKILKELGEFPSSRAQYGKFLKKLISHGQREIGEGAVVLVNPKDQALARKLSKNAPKEDAGISGGAVVTNRDGTISIDSSLESIFAQNEDDLRKLVYTEIFGGKKK